MKQRISDKDKLLIINKHKAGLSVTEICKSYNISRSTFYVWIKKFEDKKDVQNYYKLNQQLKKNKEIVEVLKAVNCTQNSPLKEKLYELEKLHGKYSIYVLCEALKVDRGTYYNHLFRNKKDKTTYAMYTPYCQPHLHGQIATPHRLNSHGLPVVTQCGKLTKNGLVFVSFHVFVILKNYYIFLDNKLSLIFSYDFS